MLKARRPISAYWTLSFLPQRCIDQRIHLVIQGTLNILYDFCVVLIPIPIVLRLNLPLRQRIIVALLFGAGFVICFAGIARTYYMYRVTDGYRDVTWDAYPVWLSTAVELYVGIVSHLPSKQLLISGIWYSQDSGVHLISTNQAVLCALLAETPLSKLSIHPNNSRPISNTYFKQKHHR